MHGNMRADVTISDCGSEGTATGPESSPLVFLRDSAFAFLKQAHNRCLLALHTLPLLVAVDRRRLRTADDGDARIPVAVRHRERRTAISLGSRLTSPSP